MEPVDVVNLIKEYLSLDIRNDLQGNQHICLLFGEEVISTINISEIWMDT